ncbi:hypothetical protein Syun_026943 [Stephania yunnanensis]|uniref:SURP motif domain-containing protein n=1 Tax=Stephania yunnanensis TaxID=152371 RepID=A0AAP0EI02_9MAGN
MDLEVVGRHALLFDDDATAAFVNSKDALVEWNSLQIDRYDVRHLLQSLPPLNRRRGASSPSSLEESQLDEERYLDLPPPPGDGGDQVQSSAAEENGGETTDARTYNSVAFSYGNADNVMEQKDSDAIGFLPPFPVPDTLLHCLMLGAVTEFFSSKVAIHWNLPPMEKLHQIMARTALFVSKHGGQSEIVLRVKQGDNPTFGFLMPDHHLHPYFRFLVDHPELLSPDKSQDKDEKAMQEQNEKEDVAGEALSLLGSVYGSVEDEDADAQSSDSKDNEPGNSPDTANVTPDHVAASLGPLTGKDEAAPKQQPPLTSKENFTIPKKTSSVNVVHSGAVKVKKRAGESSVKIPVSADKAKVSTNISSTSKSELIIVEPPSDMKRVIEKIVEYIMKNGKEFEAVLMEQDTTNRRFPFLLASNQYHPYYLKVLLNAQESKQAGKGYSSGQASGKRSAHDKDTGTALSKELAGYDLPYDNKKEKFRMVISGQKKDSQDPPQKPTPQQGGVSVDAVAAILEAARRGVRNPNLDILRPALVDAPVSSFGDRSSVSTSEASVAKVIASASEAGSSDASLTKEQKLKSERLKRAKMFAAMIKSGAVPRLSAEPPDSVSSGSVGSGSKSEKQDGSCRLQMPRNPQVPKL